MSFNTGLSGLNAANKALNVTGNNIANVATTGFKASRAEFADQYSNSIRGTSGGKTVVGTGGENRIGVADVHAGQYQRYRPSPGHGDRRQRLLCLE